MFSNVRAFWRKTTIGRSSAMLSRSDQRKIFAVVGIQILLGLLDLIGVALIGMLGALAITGIESKGPGNRVNAVLNIMHLTDQTLQFQATVIGLLAAAFLITKTVFSVFFVRKTIFFLARRSAAFSASLISKILAQPLIQLQNKSMQQTLYSVTSGVDAIAIGILNTVVLLISDTSLLIIMTIGLFIVDPIMAFSTFLIFALIAISLYQLLQVRATKLGIAHAEITIMSSEKILEVLNSYREIVIRNRRSYYSREIGKLRFTLANVSAERSFMPNISKYVIEVTVVLGSLAIGAIQFSVSDASHAVAVLSIFLAASTRIAPAVLRLQQGAVSIRANMGSAAPTLELIEILRHIEPIETSDDTVDTQHSGFRADVVVKNVSISYPTKEMPAVSNVTVNFNEGQIIAFVGPSGAGKTTLIDLILGVLSPDEGETLISGVPSLAAIKTWPGAVGYVPQDVVVSNGTIRENVALGFPISKAKDELIWDALRIAQLDDFVIGLPQGLDTPVGDRGAKISGGQRQRLGIARAMFTKPLLLVLDEATSSLDGETEASITGAIHNMKGSVTVVMIAHRLSTVREADMVVYMDAGKVISVGTFNEVRKAVPDFDRQASLMGLR
jgi:ABC-type multidrug transport system fused ATPase/permease subunit